MSSAATPIYPYAFSNSYVKVTSFYGAEWDGWRATDPSKSLTGDWAINGWVTAGVVLNKFNIAYGDFYRATRIYIENSHASGGSTDSGVKDFSIWGSNSQADFDNVSHSHVGTWTSLETNVTSLTQHVAANMPDPQYVDIINPTKYKYYSLKVLSSWGAAYVGLRRIVFMAEPPPVVTLPFLSMRGRDRMR